MFSKSCQYALQSVLYIAIHGDSRQPIKIKEISEKQNIPIHFLGKILQILVKHKILVSVKGPTGGFILSDDKNDLTLLKIVEVVDGLDIFNQCGIGLRGCSDEQPCPIHNEYKVVKAKIRTLLEEKTLNELCKDVESGKSIVSFIEN